jgi:hypothetical protein
MDTETSVELEAGDFVYQSNQELFLVVMEENDNSYVFAVHGWREIDKDRLDGYVEREDGRLFKQDDVDTVIDENADDDTTEHYERLREFFSQYSNADFPDSGPHTEFTLDDT